MDNIQLKIKEALNDVNAWQRVPTSLNGIYLVKTPQKAGKETILVEINPKLDGGKLLKRRGLFLKNVSELQKFIKLINNEKLYDVLLALENISGEKEDEKIEPINI
ncbi:MAG: hypothetical protein WAL81_06160 [Methanobacterium sp.]